MAKKEKKEKKEKKTKEKAQKGSGSSFKARLFLVVFILLAIAFLPTSLLLLVGMLPSMLIFVFHSRRSGFRVSTVVAMNMAGCIPFIFKLWSSDHTFEMSIEILTGRQALLVMYTSAAFGVMIDWVVTGLVSSYLYQKGVLRMKAIKKRQQVIIEQWGREVAAGLPGEKHTKEKPD